MPDTERLLRERARPPGWCPVTLAEALSRYQKQHRPTGYSTAHLVCPSAEGWRAPVDRKVIAERARQSLARLGAALAGDGVGA